MGSRQRAGANRPAEFSRAEREDGGAVATYQEEAEQTTSSRRQTHHVSRTSAHVSFPFYQ
uniref:Uncharacterized protein n=1 Tax=Leersia perrieri TaxID=77586 RepID=A0A0D9X042_9ORYZ